MFTDDHQFTLLRQARNAFTGIIGYATPRVPDAYDAPVDPASVHPHTAPSGHASHAPYLASSLASSSPARTRPLRLPLFVLQHTTYTRCVAHLPAVRISRIASRRATLRTAVRRGRRLFFVRLPRAAPPPPCPAWVTCYGPDTGIEEESLAARVPQVAPVE